MSHKDKQSLPVIGITMGDLNGIGPELVLETFSENNLQQLCIPVIYASAHSLLYFKKSLNIKSFNFHVIANASEAQARRVNVVAAWDNDVKIEPGVPSSAAGIAAAKSLEYAANDYVAGYLDAIVTAPINKKTAQSAEFNYPGQTEFFAAKCNSDQYAMMLVGETLKVAVVTGHQSLKSVSETINKKRIVKYLKVLNRSLIEDFRIERPKIAVLGINPHAGEEGLLGNEEAEAIIPAIEEANRQNILCFGPFPADGFFGTSQYCQFDLTLAMYHDQGLVPFKLLEFERGVNFTAGLPLIRTSPDHGTAYGLAGKAVASATSFIEAIYLAVEIRRNRMNYAENNANPLERKLVREREH